jgi:SAM-dependent methyltransferase
VTPRALAGAVVALLPPERAAIAVVGPDAAAWRVALAAAGWTVADDGVVPAAVLSFLGEAGDAAARRAALAAVARRLPPSGRLVVVDHNRPRRAFGRLWGVPALWRRGLRAARARYPTAREVAASGFVVERLVLPARERVQLVLARPRDGAAALRTT